MQNLICVLTAKNTALIIKRNEIQNRKALIWAFLLSEYHTIQLIHLMYNECIKKEVIMKKRRNISLSAEALQQLSEMAKKEGRSLSSMIEQLILRSAK